MFSSCCFIIFFLIFSVTKCDSSLEPELQLADLELADRCEELAAAKKTAILTSNFIDKIQSEEELGEQLKHNAKYYESLQNEDGSENFRRNLTLLTQPGDALLPLEDWNKIVLYLNNIEELIETTKIPCPNGTKDCFLKKSDYENLLKTSKDAKILKETWSEWQNIYNGTILVKKEQFSENLKLLKKAASLNGQDEVKAYWEMLIDGIDAYSTAENFWEEIKPFYDKFQKFVKKRLYSYYKIKEEGSKSIPIYLLGTNLGNDWSNIADIILPHPQVHFDIETNLKYKDLKKVYEMAENVTKKIHLGNFGRKFWNISKFNSTECNPIILTQCTSEQIELIECNKPSWKSYLDAYETAFKMALINRDYQSYTRENLRFSPTDESILELGTLFGIEQLTFHGILDKDVFKDDNSKKMTKLLLTALRILPKLPYYLMADKWRLEEIENASQNIAKSFWEKRQEYQGVEGVTNEEHNFLADKTIISNRPYLNKFFGTITAFQIIENYQGDQYNSSNPDLLKKINEDYQFQALLKEKPISDDWAYLLTLIYGIEPSASSILKYFQPLEDYFETAPEKQAPIVTTTTTTTTTTTKKPAVILQANFVPEVILNDSPSNNNSSTVLSTKTEDREDHVTMYVGVGLLLTVACLLVAAFAFKKLRKRTRGNNRRFAT